MEELRTPLQRISLCVMAAMIVVFGILTAVFQSIPGVKFHEKLLRVSQEGEMTLYTGKLYYEDVSITVYPDGGGTAVDFVTETGPTHHCRVDYPGNTIIGQDGRTYGAIRVSRDGEVLFDGGYDAENDRYCELDGSFHLPIGFGFSTGGGNPWYGFDFGEMSILRFAHGPELSARGSWAAWGMMSAVAVLMMLPIAYPIALFRWKHSLSVKDPEPSEFYLSMCKVECVVLPVFMLLSYIWSLTLIE